MKITTATEIFSVMTLATKGALLKNSPAHANIRQNLYTEDADFVVLIVEATLALYFQLRNASNKSTIAISMCSFYHSITGRSCTGSALRLIDTLVDELSSDLPWFQSGLGWIDILDGLYTNTKRVVKSALGDKIARVFNHVVAIALYAKAGIKFDPVFFGDIEKKHIRPTIWNVVSFIDAIVGLVLFLCKAGRQAISTGSLECFFIDDSVLTDWVDKASALRKDFEFLGNPSAVGMALPQYIHDLQEAIATGKKLLPHFKTGREHTVLMNMILELEVLHKRQQVTMMAASFRRAPVGVFLYGTAGVAKSFIATGLFNHYCSVRGISKEASTMWTRTENDDFYSGYKSHFAGVLYDDAAKYRANVVQGVDPSIGDIISAINNIQFVTPQADLPDKGKIPFRSEWVGVTSNVDDLAANLYFNSSAAFLRRFSVRIQPIVKDEFRVRGEDKIDTSKIPPGVQYPNLWDFHVCLPRVNGMTGEFVPFKTFTDYAGLLEYMTEVYKKHITQQDALMTTVGMIGPEPLCDCNLPVSICRCEATEGGPILFGMPDVEAQSDCVCTKKHWVRVGALNGQKHRLYKQHTDRVVRAFLDQVYSDPLLGKWFSPTFCDHEVAEDDAVIVKRMTQHVEACIQEFLALDPRDRMNALTDGAFARVDEGPDLTYLTFEPRFGPRGHFLESQLQRLRDNVAQFCGTLSCKEQALLDVYIQEEAPAHIAAGWAMGDIVRGGYDYVKFYSDRVEDPDRVEVREFMLGTREKCWYERLGVRIAVSYFENRWTYKLINCLATIPLVQSAVIWLLQSATDSPRSVLGAAGRRYDILHGANNKYVCIILGAMSFVGIAVLVARFVSSFRGSHKHEVSNTCHEQSDCGSTPPDYAVGEPRDPLPDYQMDLNSVGKLPTVRTTEKVNVWTVKERSITRLDVDARRPHNETQLEAALRNNVVFACVYGEMPLGKGKANTRALVIDSETLLLNNHALPRGCRVEIWVGPVSDEGVKPSFILEVDERMVVRHPDRDIAIIKTWAMPHRFKDIKHLLTKASYESVGPSAYYVRHKDHGLEVLDCVGVTLSGLQGLAGAESVVCQAWSTRPTRATVSGECGSPLVIHSTLGSVVVGIHAGFNPMTGTAWAVRIFREDFDSDRHPEVGIIKPAYPVAQVGGFLELGPNDKLYTDYHPTGHLMTHGQLKSFVARPKFTGTYTPYAHTAFALGVGFDPPIVDNMAAPRNAGWKQPQLVLANYLQPTHSMHEMVMRACVQAYCEHIEAGLTQEDLDDIHPVPLDVAVNGFPGVPNVDAQKHSTSAGHGKRGPKLQFLSKPERNGVWDSFREFDAQTLAEIDVMRESMRAGVRPHAIYDACWKNEMLSKAKVEAGKARSIYMCPLAFLANIRMSTMGLCRVMIRRRDLFGIAVGLNTHSEEWDAVHKLAQAIPGDNWIASDFQAFEAVLNLLISNCTSKVFQHTAGLSGRYDDEEMMAFRVMLADISNATINFFGELITLLGGEASGHQLTTFFNCIANNLLHMYAYVLIYKEGDEFDEYLRVAREWFDKVFRNTLGDDVYLKVHPERSRYNHTTIQKVFADIGITYTMAEKGAASKPYVGLEEVSFLKRKFVDHSAFPGMKVAALDRKSIYKMICYTVPSHSASAEEQLAASLASAQAEAFFHDREFFAQVQELIQSLPKSAELEFRISQMPPPTWNGMITRFVRASPQLQVRMLVPGDAETNSPMHSYCHVSALELQTRWSVDAWGSTTMGRSPEDRFYGGVRLSTKTVPTDDAFEIALDPDNIDFSKNFSKTNTKSPTTEERDMAPKVVAQAINKVRRQVRERKRREKWSGVAQADITYDTSTVPGTGAESSVDVKQQQIVFKNEPSGVQLSAPAWRDEIAQRMTIQQDIGHYLNRPRIIKSYVWAENGANGYKTDFQPWQLFFNDTTMANKLQGFHLLRCTLKVKFLINGSPFYYGSMMATYTPLNGYRLDTAEAVGIETRLTATSQKPHVWLENQNCSTAEMTLPFLYPYPFLDIGTLANLTNMGTIHFSQFAPLLSANGTSSSNVDIQVYAWAEDVQLSGPTSMPVLQSEFVADGQISGPASAVASVARSLKDTPIIGPYAKATEMIATSVGSVAKYFGFTNVPNVRDISGMKQVPFSLASSEISEPVQKLSMQAKQETSLGAAQHGGGTDDELHLAHFCGRSGYITGPTWSTTDVPDKILFTACVAPQMFTRTATEIAHLPMSYAANFFQYWRGSIKYTFKVVRSPYHRGRIQISWDSGTSNMTNGGVIGNPNTLTTIMDLDEDSECSFVVPYMQPQLFTQTYPVVDTGTQLWASGALPTGTFTRSNGVISVRVLNRLTAPEASSSATILVFANACDDIEFAGPRDFVTAKTGAIMSLNPATSGIAQSDIQYNDVAEAAELMPRGDSGELYNQVFGEKITSLREYMHRSSLSFLWYPGAADANVGTGAIRIPIKRMPPPPGVSDNGWWLGTTISGAGQTVFYTKMHPILALSTCFIGYKGSVNVNVNVDQPATSLATDTLSVYRVQNGDGLTAAQRRPSVYVYSNPANSIGVNAQQDNMAVNAGRAGLALTNTKTNAGLSAQLPYYSSSGFQMCDPRREYSNTDTFTDRNNDWWTVEWRYNKTAAATSTAGALTSVYYATGPDFDCVFFINVPVLTVVAIAAP
jgi:hypothetical protein